MPAATAASGSSGARLSAPYTQVGASVDSRSDVKVAIETGLLTLGTVSEFEVFILLLSLRAKARIRFHRRDVPSCGAHGPSFVSEDFLAEDYKLYLRALAK